jgi:hypothetical protein
MGPACEAVPHARSHRVTRAAAATAPIRANPAPRTAVVTIRWERAFRTISMVKVIIVIVIIFLDLQ